MIDFQGAAHGAFVIGLRFLQVGEGAEFRALSSDEVALGENDVVNSGGPEPVFLLLGVKGLRLKFACFAGGFDLSAILSESDICVANIEERGIFQLSKLGFQLTLCE